MKIVKFETENGIRYGIRAWCLTYDGNLHCGPVYFDFLNTPYSYHDYDRWLTLRCDRFERRCMVDSEDQVLTMWDRIILERAKKVRIDITQKGKPVSITELRKKQKVQEDETDLSVTDEQLERWGSR